MQQVKVARCLPSELFESAPDLSSVDTCLKKGSIYRFVTIKPALLNNQKLKQYIEVLLTSPYYEMSK